MDDQQDNQPEQESAQWTLRYGFHRGTYTSRDSGEEEFPNELQARLAFVKARNFNSRFGYVVWYAEIESPDGVITRLAPDNNDYT